MDSNGNYQQRKGQDAGVQNNFMNLTTFKENLELSLKIQNSEKVAKPKTIKVRP